MADGSQSTDLGNSKKAPVPGRCSVAAVGAQFTEGAWGRPIYGAPKAMPCPFCADLAEIMHQIEAQTREEAWDGGDVFVAQCSGCGCQGPGRASAIEAAEAWNHRPAVASVPTLGVDLAKEGMAWFNRLSERERAAVLKAANTSVPAEAWAHYKRSRGLALVAIPANPLCIEDDALDTLYTAHAMMELIDALDCNEGTSEFEMPKSGSGSVASLRKLVLDSMQYAADLGTAEEVAKESPK